ncbi:MAG: IPExxxVDY family protein [Bacteroidetes bacterium]|nr:IPExxxVDY family protein [Bacteroidota bacterium]
MATKKLKTTTDYDFLLVAIVCPENDYRLCREINIKLRIPMKRAKTDIEHFPPGKKLSVFSLFEYLPGDNEPQYNLISNKSSGELLVPAFKRVDYFLRIKGPSSLIQREKILLSLSEIPFVLSAFEAPPEKIKSKEILLLS